MKWFCLIIIPLILFSGCDDKEAPEPEKRTYVFKPVGKDWFMVIDVPSDYREIFESFDDKIDKLSSRITTLTKRLECLSEGGHDLVYDRLMEWYDCLRDARDSRPSIYVFKCSNCGYEKKMLWKDLSCSQKKALRELGIPKGEME